MTTPRCTATKPRSARRSGRRHTEERIVHQFKTPQRLSSVHDALRAFDRSLNDLQTDYLDLYLIHAPMPLRDLYCEAWRALETLYLEDRVRAIGLSNFNVVHMRKIFEAARVRPMINELECNPVPHDRPAQVLLRGQRYPCRQLVPPRRAQKALIPYPVDHYKVLLEDDLLSRIVKKYGKTTAQVALRWAVDSDMTPIPKSANPARIHQNRDIFDFSLTAEEVKKIAALNHDRRLGPDFDVFDGA